jgi:threonine dehydratase
MPPHPRPQLVAEAAARLAGRVVHTPLLEASTLNRLVGDRLKLKHLRVFVKAENLQHTGAFKFRGATNKLLQLDAAQRDRGVVAFSSGNFAQALALASHNIGVRCTIVSPHDAPPLKLARTRAYGATVVTTTPAAGENREVCAAARAEQIARDTGATLLHPFDDWDVIYGQGSLALEIYEQAGCALDALVVPCGGGGMLAGCSLATKLVSPMTRVFAVEPEGYNDHCLSFSSVDKARTPLPGPAEGAAAQPKTICDALQANAPGRLTWEVNQNMYSTC